MRNVFKLFSYDIKHLFGNVITVVIVLGLVFLPSIFTWYNVIACWNVFDNTGNLKVAVANSDEGYQSDLLPTKINVGDSVESALRANDQLDWVFTDEEDAIDGARSGKYYAAVVIPQSFSSDMMSFYSDDAEHAELIYYENEKKNAVAPRVTDQASSKVAAQVNTTFAETISDVALGLIDSLGTVADDADAAGQVAKLSGTISSSADQMRTAADVLESYANLAGTAQALVGSSTQLLGNAQNAVKDAQQQASGAKSGAETIGDALTTSASSLSDALAQSSDGFNQVPAAIDKVYAQVDTDKANAAQSLRDQAADVDSQIERYQQLIEVLESIKPQLDEQYRPAVDAVVSQLNTSISSLGKLRDSLTSAADKMATGNDPESSARADIQAKLDEAKANADKLKNDYENNLKPGLESLASSVAQAAQSLSARASQLSGVGDGLNGAASSVASDLAGAQSAIRAMSDELHGSADKMSALSQRVNEALASGNVEQLKQVIGSDPEALAKAVSAPVGVERIAVFPVEDFGSAMAPLYTHAGTMGGVVAIMVLLNPVPSGTRQARGGAGRAQVLAAVLRALRRAVRIGLHAIDGGVPGQHAVRGGPGCKPAAVPCVLLDGGLRVQLHHLHAGVAVRQPWQGACRAAAHHLRDRRRWQLPLAAAARLLPGRQPVFAGDARHQRHARGEHGRVPERFLGADRHNAYLHRTVRDHGHPAAGALALHVLVRGAGGEIEGGRLADGCRKG